MEANSAEELKNQGNDALKAGDVDLAIERYSRSLGKLALKIFLRFGEDRRNINQPCDGVHKNLKIQGSAF